MWNLHAIPTAADLICHVFHHWSGHQVDRSEIVLTTGACTPMPREGDDDHGLPAWYLARSVPRRLCPHAQNCTRCAYALGEVTGTGDQAARGEYSLSA